MTSPSRALRASLAALCSLAMIVTTAACSDTSQPAPAITLDAAPTASPIALDGPDPDLTLEPSPAGDPALIEPLTGQAAGAPVIPEIYMASINEGAGTLTIVAYVPTIFEDGGRCFATVATATGERTQETRSEADATGTACGLFTFSLAELGSGEATISARYESADHQGESAQLKVDVP